MFGLFALVLVLSPQAQDQVRSAGRVLDLEGAPVANAEVTFLSRPIPRSLAAGPERRVLVRTDERGMYRVSLDRDVRYSAWARWDTAASGIADGVIGGEFLQLHGAPNTGTATIRLAGAEAWSDADTFRLRVLLGSENIDFTPLERVDDGWRLLAQPSFGFHTIEVLDAGGEVLWAQNVYLDDGEGVINLPAPVEYRVEVRDEEDKPIAGADVLWHIKNYWYAHSNALPWGERFRSLWPRVGTTDEHGTVTIRIPDHAQNVWLITRKDGYRMSIEGRDRGMPIIAGKRQGEAAVAGAPIEVQLHRSEPWVVPLTVDGELPLADDWLHLVCRVSVSSGGGGGSGTPLNLTVPVVGGRATLASPLPLSGKVEIADVVLGRALAQRLRDTHGFEPRRTWRLPHPEALLEDTPRVQFDEEELCALQVTMADGRPAAHAVVMALAGCDGKGMIYLRTDRLGRTLVPPGQVAVLGARGFGAGEVIAEDATSMQLQMHELKRLPAQIIDADGAPMPFVNLRINQLSGSAIDHDKALAAYNALMPLRPALRADGDGRLELPLPAFACDVKLMGSGLRLIGGEQINWDPASIGVHQVVAQRR